MKKFLLVYISVILSEFKRLKHFNLFKLMNYYLWVVLGYMKI